MLAFELKLTTLGSGAVKFLWTNKFVLTNLGICGMLH